MSLSQSLTRGDRMIARHMICERVPARPGEISRETILVNRRDPLLAFNRIAHLGDSSLASRRRGHFLLRLLVHGTAVVLVLYAQVMRKYGI